MYKRHVFISLVVITVASIASGIVAAQDPFKNGAPWASWAALSALAALGSFAAIITTIRYDGKSEKDYFSKLGGDTVWFVIVGAFVVGGSKDYVSAANYSLWWAALGTAIVTFILTSLVGYIFTDHREEQQAEVRRLAS